MTRRKLLKELDLARVEASIGAAERLTSAELRVSIAGLFWGSPRRVAERAFHRLGMDQTSARNGVLLFLIPWRRRMEIVADEGAARVVAEAFWADVVARLRERFRAGAYAEGLEAAVDTIARELARHFPPAGPQDRNELPDHVDIAG